MKFLVLSDIHGNGVALRAVLGQAPSHDGVICLGDYLWTSLGNREVIRWVQRTKELLGKRAVMTRGNSDGMEYYDTYGSLSQNDPRPLFEYLQTLPTQARLSVEGHSLLALHSFPKPAEFDSAFEERRSLLPWMRPGYVKTALPLGDVRVLVFGDIHLPYAACDGDLLAIDPGSVGFNLDGDTRTSFMILDLQPDSITVEHHRVAYDIQTAVRDVELAHRDSELGRQRGRSYASLLAGGRQGPFTWTTEWGRTQWAVNNSIRRMGGPQHRSSHGPKLQT